MSIEPAVWTAAHLSVLSGKNIKNKSILPLVGIFMFHACHIALLCARFVKVTVVDTGSGEPVVASTPFFPLSDAATFLSVTIGLIGFLLIGVSLFVTKCRARWFFWYMLIISVLMIPILLGIISLVYLIVKRDEFKPIRTTDPSVSPV